MRDLNARQSTCLLEAPYLRRFFIAIIKVTTTAITPLKTFTNVFINYERLKTMRFLQVLTVQNAI